MFDEHTREIIAFRDERDWQKFHSSSDLAPQSASELPSCSGSFTGAATRRSPMTLNPAEKTSGANLRSHWQPPLPETDTRQGATAWNTPSVPSDADAVR